MDIPNWLDDSECVAPCPCGEPPEDGIIIVLGVQGLRRWFHEPCMSFLAYDVTEEQYQDMDEWRKHRNEAEDPEV